MKLKSIALTLFTTCAISLSAADLLPGDIVLHAQTNPFDDAIKDVESYVLEAAKGTPMALQFQPGMFKLMLPMMTNLPAGSIDMSKSVHILVGSENQKTSQAFFMPITDIKTAASGSPGVITNTDGTYKLANGIFLAPTRPGYVAMSKNLAEAKKMAEAFKKVTLPKKMPAYTFSLTIDADKVLKNNMEDIQAGKTDMIKNLAKASKEEASIKGIDMFMGSAIDELINLVSQLEGAQVNIDISGKETKIQTQLMPKNATELASLATIYSKVTPQFSLSNSLPQNMPLSFSGQYSPEVTAVLSKIIKRFADDMAAMDMLKAIPDSVDLFMKLYDLYNGETSMAMRFGENSTYDGCGFSKVKETKSFIDLYQKSMTASADITNSIYKQVKIPIQMKCEVVEGKGKIKGVQFNLMRTKYELTKPESQLTPEEKAMTEAFKTMPENTIAIAALDSTTVIYAMGPNYKQILTEGLANYMKKSAKPSRNTMMMKNMPNNQIGSAIIYPLNLVRGAMQMQFKNSQKMSPQTTPALNKQILETIGLIPDSKHPVLVSYGVTGNNLVSEMVIPCKTLAEVFQTIMQVQTKVIEQQMQQPPVAP